MYCINCGVRLADTEKKCPLCNTVVYHPDMQQTNAHPLYPENKMPKSSAGSKFFCGAFIIVFLIPLIICFLSDMQDNKTLDWFGYVAGGLLVAYIALALPLWFRKPNPVIFVPCTFAAATLYLLYINAVNGGNWFLSFAFPLSGSLCVIVSAAVTLLYYLRKGKLYIIGGATITLGAFMLLIEFLIQVTFHLPFIGWSIYPLVALVLIGSLLIYLAINRSAQETIERKLFF